MSQSDKCPNCGDEKFQYTPWGKYCVGKGNCGFLPEKEPAPEEPPKETCPKCGNEIATVQGVKVHMDLCEAPKPTVCRKCGNKNGYDTFWRDGDDPHYACGGCGEREHVPAPTVLEREGKG